MTPRQKELARQALGLPNNEGIPTRNYFVAVGGADNFVEWSGLVASGAASVDADTPPFASIFYFTLTRTGAEAALDDGEHLDPLDFETAEI